MFINLSIEAYGITQDIRIDNGQKIGECLRVLQQSGRLPPGEIPPYFCSQMMQTLVSPHQTFEEAKIFDGDTLSGV